jgi:predicted PurR-regulated permease PerM
MEFVRENIWLLALAVAFAIVWLLGSSIAPFLVGAFAAYLLDPIVAWLARRGWSRGKAALLLVFVVFALALGAALVLAPLLIGELNVLLERAPELLQGAYRRFWATFGPYAERFGLSPDWLSGDIIGKATEQVTATVSQLGAGLLMAVDLLFLAFLTPFVAYWLLRDWPLVVARTRALVPRRSQATVDALAAKLDRRLAGWIRGQALICLIQAAWHSLGLLAIGLDGWLLIGIATGLAGFVPVIGNATLFVVALVVALIQFDALLPVAGVVALYGVSQLLEDTVLYPNLVGARIDLHPLWVIFALLVAATLFGLPGALLAMPLACFAEVIVDWLVERYRASSFYRRAA